jgi:hypothetical protein
MAIKVTTQIGTSGGITSQAYIRIGTYLIDKPNSIVRFTLEIYNQESDKSNRDNLVTNKEIGAFVYEKATNFTLYETEDIFTAGYGTLRTHLQSIYGPSSTVDC